MIKFFPFANKIDHNPEEIRGPYLPKPIKREWFLYDNRLRFKAPSANPILSFSHIKRRSVGAIDPGNKNIPKNAWERIHSSISNGPPSEWDNAFFYSNTWYFVGPWFSGAQARLKMNGILYTAEPKYSFADKNLFHPRIFEAALANYLDYAFGYTTLGTKTKPYFRGPFHWQVLPISNSIQAIVCDIHFSGCSPKDNPSYNRYVLFPISPQQFILLGFDFGDIKIHDKVRYPPLKALCDSIIHSLQLQVGEQTLAEWNRVKASCPDMSLTKTMGEFPWPLGKDKKPKKPKEVDITPHDVQQDLPHQGSL